MADVYADKHLLEQTAARLAFIVTGLVALSIATPYFYTIPKENLNLITQGQTTLFNGWMLVLALYFKTRGSTQQDQDTISTLAQTAQQAQTTLSNATSPTEMKLNPGDTATATATESGTSIKKDAGDGSST